MHEEWKRLVYHGNDYGDWYEISNLGQIRNSKTGCLRKLKLTDGGYHYVGCSFGSRNDKKAVKIHRAVAETFISNPNNFNSINHKDGNKLNNHVDNLEWCTVAYNNRHAWSNGLIKPRCGVDNPSSKLTENDVRYIRKHYIAKDKEYGARALGKRFGVSHCIISKIVNYKSYTNVE